MIIYPLNYLFYTVNVQLPVYALPLWENYFKSVHQPIPTRENWEHPGIFQNKSGSSAFNWVLPFYFLKWNCYFSACKRKFLESTSPVFLQTLHQYSVPSNNSPILFLAQTFYTLFKRSQLKCKFLKFSSARVELRQISHVNFELASQFLFKFCIILHCHDTKLLCKF